MESYVVTAVYTPDDYRMPDAKLESKVASSAEDAITYAVEFYLNEVGNVDTFDYENSEEFDEIVNKYKNNFNQLIEHLYEYFKQNEDNLFAGEFVPNTFCVKIEDQKVSITTTRQSVLQMISTLYNKNQQESA